MLSLLDKLAAAAAAAGAPGGGPAQQQGGQSMDPNMDPSMAPPPDPIEQDNQRLTNILQNLQLRKEVVQAQAELEMLSKQTSTARKSAPKDPDRPRKTAVSDDVTSASSLGTLVKSTPKLNTNKKELQASADKRTPKDVQPKKNAANTDLEVGE